MPTGVYPRSLKTRKILSDAHKGVPLTQATKLKLSLIRRGRPQPWRKGKSPSKETIEKMIITRNSDEYKNKIQDFWNNNPEIRTLYSERKRGELCNFWNGGVTKKNRAARNGTEIDSWKKSVSGRDDYTCQKCKKRGGRLNVHHIFNFLTYPQQRTEINNGITFCIECHRLFHSIFNKFNNTDTQVNMFTGGEYATNHETNA